MDSSPESNISRDIPIEKRAELLIDYWKQTSNVQQHFNDVSMKLRNFAVVVFSGFLTGVGLAIHKSVYISILGTDISAGVLFALAGMVATQLIHFMDTYWYHVFLKGAVTTSASIEKEINNILGVTELSDGISTSSQKVAILSLFGVLHFPVGWKDYLKYTYLLRKVEVDSTIRHKIFYRWLLAIFIVTGIGSIFTHSNDSAAGNTFTEKQTSPVNVINITPIPMDEVKKTLTVENNTGFIISGTNVRVRNNDSFNSPIIALLPVGKQVLIMDDDRTKSWVQISCKDDQNKTISGWVHRDFIASMK